MADQDLTPYPNSTDKVRVAVYCTKTGIIRQVADVALHDAHRQHAAHPEHDYIEVTGQFVHPREHAVDLKTMQIVPRTLANVGDHSAKEQELRRAHADALIPKFDMTAVMLNAALGDEAAKATAREYIALRLAADQKLAGLLKTLAAAKARCDVDDIHWG